MSTRSGRAKTGQFLIEGPQAVREAQQAGLVVRLLMTAAAARRHPDLATGPGAERGYELVGDDVIAGLADTVTSQGVVAIGRTPTWGWDGFPERPRLVVVCDRIRDPGNAGAVIRCADAFGADAVVFTEGSVEPVNPKVVRSTTGSLFHLPLVTGADLPDTVARLRGAGLRVLATDGEGSDDLAELDARGDLGAPVAWVFGTEATGLDEAGRSLADETVRIPMWGRAESLNLATAAAVCLYTTAVAQQRRVGAGL